VHKKTVRIVYEICEWKVWDFSMTLEQVSKSVFGGSGWRFVFASQNASLSVIASPLHQQLLDSPFLRVRDE
jgi:hypothetical protein